MKSNKIIYWLSTSIMCLIFLFSAFLYVFGHDIASVCYAVIGFPTWILYPSALLKVLGVVAILSRKSSLLKEWAYAGFFFCFLLATSSHMAINDGECIPSMVAIVLLFVSYFTKKKTIFHN